MSQECNHQCDSCEQKGNCESKDMHISTNLESHIKNCIAVVSGKGGVGKSFITSLLASYANRLGNKTGIIDADITGPSIPKAFGVVEKMSGDDKHLYPIETKSGIKIVSSNLLLEDDSQPIIWRGPMIAGIVKQFYSDTNWGDIDQMLIDCPPGTGDVPLTIFQSIHLSGIIIVTSPQELVEMIVAKATNMAKMMNIPVLGIVENMGYYECPNCHERNYIFGDSHIEEIAKKEGIPNVVSLPINATYRTLVDKGMVEDLEIDSFNEFSNKIFS